MRGLSYFADQIQYWTFKTQSKVQNIKKYIFLMTKIMQFFSINAVQNSEKFYSLDLIQNQPNLS